MKLGIPESLTVVSRVGHFRESHGSLFELGWDWALQGVSRYSVGIGHSREAHGSLWGWTLQVSAGEE